MAKQSNWSGAEKFGVGVLAGCLHEKLTENIVSLVGTCESLLDCVEKSNPEIAKLFKSSVEKAKAELLSQDI